ncbi:hypothetical protein JW905_13985 [bacterium]|nr:hypothetical protein [candidate division CSSED10-310 bacterium]
MPLYPSVIVSEEMLAAALNLVDAVRVRRTVASEIDTLTGILGEFAFARYFFGDWRAHRVGHNRGETDFDDIEIKTSSFPFHAGLHLLVREDYAASRKPACYVQVILNVANRDADRIPAGTNAVICGWATAAEVDRAPLRDWGSKFGTGGGYRCHGIRIADLHPMNELRLAMGSGNGK